MGSVRVGDRLIGPREPVFIIAEIGYNFNTLEEAKASIDAAVDCGADAVKFQTFKAETVTSRFTDFPVEAGATNQFEEFKRYEMSEETHQQLFEHAGRRGVIAFSTPSYFDDVDLLERLGVPLYKIGSDDLTNLPFITYIARKGKPLIFSTGMGTLAEVAEAYETITVAGNNQAMILYCVSNYPLRDLSLLDLNVIPSFSKTFQIPVGFSDHTSGFTAAIAAVALGASIVERHFSIDKNLQVPDAFFAADTTEMKSLVKAVRELEQALGDGIKRPAVTEAEMRLETRKSVIARTEIRPGTTITRQMVIVKRPGRGIPPKLSDLVIGRRARKLIHQDEVITWEKLD